jgi:hypothetical protein
MRRFAVASAILAALLALPAAQAVAARVNPSTATTDTDRATAALEYLLAAQASDGSIDGSIGETADYVIGAAAAGFDPATLRGCAGTTGALDFLAAASDGASGDAAKTGKAVVAIAAAGGDPAGFAGRDMVARLTALYDSTTGAYGDGSTFSQSFAILGMAAAGETVPAAATAELSALQDADGSWSYGTAPVAAGDGDTNSTAIAVMALDSAGEHAADAAALTYLRSQQLSDGGFPYQNSATYGPPASDPDSDSVVLEALLAAGQDPESAAWTQGSNTVLSQLRAMQGTDGGFEYPGSGESAFTTSQVPAALMRAPYAAPVHFVPGAAVPATQCAAASPSPAASQSPAPSSTASTTALPTAAPTARPPARPTSRPTLRPTPKPTVAPQPAAQQTETATDSPTVSPGPSPTPTPSPSATPTAGTTSAVAGATAYSAGGASSADPGRPGSGLGSAVIYGLALLAGLAVVLGAGWVLMARPARRP